MPKPENIDATNDNRSSFLISLDSFVLVTSYTKNQAVKKIPMPSKTKVK